jgi:hypothetical protein
MQQQQEGFDFVNKINSVAMTNHEIIQAAIHLKIPFFRGVFLRNELPKEPLPRECGVLNLDNKNGTHWTLYMCNSSLNLAIFMDPYGNLPPPPEILKYFKQYSHVYYNFDKYQFNFGDHPSFVCGQWVLLLLMKLSDLVTK